MASNRLNQVAALQLMQRLDAQNVGWLSQQIERLRQGDCGTWVLDMAQVEFLDSQGLVGLVAARQVAAGADAQLVLCGLKRQVQMVLDLAQLDQVFAIVETMEALPTARLSNWVTETPRSVVRQAA
jgi:anti-sigma B factor antagonist